MNAIPYRQEGDYQIPDLTLDEQPLLAIGKYGLLRKRFLQNHRRGTYSAMILSQTLHKHLLETDSQAKVMLEREQQRLLKANPLPKTDATLELARHRNMILAQAEEAVLNDLIYS